MKHFIYKSAVVAEIEKLKDEAKIHPSDFGCGRLSICKELINFLDTIEAKNVDLDNEITDYINKHYHIRYDETLENGSDPLTVFDVEDIARYFFELGRSSK